MTMAAMDSWTVMNTLCVHVVTFVFLAGAYIHNRCTVLHTLVARDTRANEMVQLVSACAPILARRRQAFINIYDLPSSAAPSGP